jgi:MYXO-CTERM domain-containing protein
MLSRRTLTLVAAIVAVALGRVPEVRAGAASAADVCAPTANPCVVDTTITVNPGVCPSAPTVLDFGTRALVIGTSSKTGRLDVGSGCMLIRAGSLTITAGRGSLRSRGDSARQVPAGAITVIVTGNAVLDGPIDANSPYSTSTFPRRAGGDIAVQAGGSISIAASVGITASSTTSLGPGGSVDLLAGTDLTIAAGASVTANGGGSSDGGFLSLIANAGTVSIANTATISATGGIGGTGGSITISANSAASLGSVVDASGGEGGEIFVDATGPVSITRQLLASGNDLDAAGGIIEAFSSGDTLTVNTSFSTGMDVSGDSSGGGSITIEAGEAVRLLGGNLKAVGSNTGEGGSIDITAETDLTSNVSLLVNSAGEDAESGVLSLVANSGSISIGGAMNASGRVGGTIDVDAGDSITVGSVTINLNGGGEFGDGGALTLVATRDVVMTSGLLVTANASVTEFGGGGGSVDVSGCIVHLPSTARMEATGSSGGYIFLTANEQMTVAGNLRTQTGTVRLAYRSGGPVPVVTGTITPAPQIVAAALPTCYVCGNSFVDPGEVCDDGGVIGCDGCSPVCQAEVCGNGSPDCGEGCDDGNTTDCDGCSSTCEIEVCGNGIPTCGEECDDGNVAGCDGCSPTCRIEACGNGTVDCGEACDDGGVPNSCCGPTCQLKVAGSACAPDGTACTDDRCTALGACEHVPNTAPCDAGVPCTIGQCSAGTCGVTGPVTACVGGDGCCPAGCGAGEDDDCAVQPIPAVSPAGMLLAAVLLALAMAGSLRRRRSRG